MKRAQTFVRKAFKCYRGRRQHLRGRLDDADFILMLPVLAADGTLSRILVPNNAKKVVVVKADPDLSEWNVIAASGPIEVSSSSGDLDDSLSAPSDSSSRCCAEHEKSKPSEKIQKCRGSDSW